MATPTSPIPDEELPRVGSPIARREDRAFVSGDAIYVDDIDLPGTVHLAVLRSQFAHATIDSIDTSEAEAMEGVIAVYTGDDLERAGVNGLPVYVNLPGQVTPDHPVLATDKVRYQGDAVAAVVAEDRYTAGPALDAIDVEYTRLDAVTDPLAATDDGAETIHAEAPDNVAWVWELGDASATDRAFEEAALTVGLELDNQRLVQAPMEPRGAIADYDPSTDKLVVHLNTQTPHMHRGTISEAIGHPQHKLRVLVPKVGGAFGAKMISYTGETLTAWCAKDLRRPVKWISTRTEDFLTTRQGRGQHTRAEMALDAEGHVLGLRDRTVADKGGYLSMYHAGCNREYSHMLAGQYAIPAIHCEITGVFTNKTPTDPYRGCGSPEATYVLERLLDLAAHELDLDPVEIRRRNFIPPESFPYEAMEGVVYDSGDYEQTLSAALDVIDYEAFREEQAAARREGRYLGIGFSCWVEASAYGPPARSPDRKAPTDSWESSLLRVNPAGTVTVYCGTADQGQGHDTVYAQIIGEGLGVPMDDIVVVEDDTDQVPMGTGTYNSRSAVAGGNAVHASVQKVIEKGRRIAAHELEVSPDDVAFEAGTYVVVGAPDRSVTFQEVARLAHYQNKLPADMEPGFEATTFYSPETPLTVPFGTHVAVVEIDPASGEIDIQRYVGVDDVGNQLNPVIVEGQIHGGVAQGLGQAFYEAAAYDDNGTLVSGSFSDYVLPKALQMPEMETGHTVTPCPFNALGLKGAGEGGAVGAPPALVNAVVDALGPWGVDHLDMPVTEEKVWGAIRDAGEPAA